MTGVYLAERRNSFDIDHTIYNVRGADIDDINWCMLDHWEYLSMYQLMLAYSATIKLDSEVAISV